MNLHGNLTDTHCILNNCMNWKIMCIFHNIGGKERIVHLYAGIKMDHKKNSNSCLHYLSFDYKD